MIFTFLSQSTVSPSLYHQCGTLTKKVNVLFVSRDFCNIQTDHEIVILGNIIAISFLVAALDLMFTELYNGGVYVGLLFTVR